MKTKLRKTDEVEIIRGKDRGKRGKILSFISKKNAVTVEGINIVKKHTKPSATSKGGIIEKEAPIDISNIMLVCPHCSKRIRIGYKFLEDGKKVRYCRKCGETI
ncbi:MAG: 50S ribosomal protein L24 [Deltaproteobacteria bacterium]|nr:50S ribosomal protein L24 [Deltaproteobacteria bacterium]